MSKRKSKEKVLEEKIETVEGKLKVFVLTKSLTTKAGIKAEGAEIKPSDLDEKSWKVWLEKGVIVEK